MDTPFKLSDVSTNTTSIDNMVKGIRQSYSQPNPVLQTNNTLDKYLKGSNNPTTRYTSKTIEDSHTKLDDGTWVAKYDTYSPNRDNERYYAETQTTGDKWLNGLTKFGGKTLTAIAGGTIGTVAGMKEWITSGNFSTVYDNDFARNLNDFNVKMDNTFPNYYSQQEKDAGFIDSLDSANFWANDFLGGLSFTVGAIGSEMIWGAVTGGASLSTTASRLPFKFGAMKGAKAMANTLTRGSAKKIASEALEEGVENAVLQGRSLSINLAKAGSLVNTTRFALTSAGYESGVEAMQFKKEAEDNFFEDFKRKNGREPNDEDITKFNKNVESAANGLYGYNMALVGSSNLLMLGSMFDIKNPLTNPSKWVNKKLFGVGLDTTTNTVVKASRAQKIAQKTFSIASPMFTEGIYEEGGQAVGSGTAQSWIESTYDPKFTKNSLGLGDAFLDAMDETYTTKEGWKEIGLGALIGALSGGAGTVYNKARGRDTEGQFQKLEREANEMMAFNKDYSPHKMANMLFYANRVQNANTNEERAREEGNITLEDKSRRDKALAQLSYAYNLDYLAETIEDTNIALESLDVNKLAEEQGISLEEAQSQKQQAITDYNSVAKEYKLNREFAENYFGDSLSKEGLDYTQTSVLKDAVAYELTQGQKSWDFSRDILTSIQQEVKNVIGGEQALSLRDIALNSTPEIQKEFDEIVKLVKENEAKIQETENNRKNVSVVKTNDIEVNRERANTLNNLVVELSRLNESKVELENRLNLLLEASNLENPFTNQASPIISTSDILRLDTTLENISRLTNSNPKLKRLLEEYSRTTNELKRHNTIVKQIRDPKMQASGSKGLSKLLLGESSKINEVTQKFIEGIRPTMETVQEQRAATLARGIEQVDQAVETISGAEQFSSTPSASVVDTNLSLPEQIVLNNKEYFEHINVDNVESAFPTQEEIKRFETLTQKAKYDENFSEYDDVENLSSEALTEEETVELNSLYDKLDKWQMLSTFEEEGISIADLFEMQAQNEQSPKDVSDDILNDEFSDMVNTENNIRGANLRTENLTQTPENVQIRENNGKYTIHNITLQGLLEGINSNDLVLIEGDQEIQVLPQAVPNSVGTQLRVNYGEDNVILTVTPGGVIEIDNSIVFLKNSNYTPISYSGQSSSSYSPLYFKGGEAVESDFNNDATYNTEAIYNLKEGDTIYFKVDLDNEYNKTLVGQSEEVVEKQIKVFITDSSGNIIGDLKAHRDVFGSEGFNLIRKEALTKFKSGVGGNLNITSEVNSVLLGVPKFTLNEDGLPINKPFNSENILDWGYWDGKGFQLKNGTGDVRTSFVKKFKRRLPVVVFRVGNQVVAFPVNMVRTPSNNVINLLDIINDQSSSLTKQVIKVNNTLLENGINGSFYYRGDADQNIFKDVATQEVSLEFIQAQKALDSITVQGDILNMNVTELSSNVLSPIDFSNKPISSPRVAMNLQNLSVVSSPTITTVVPKVPTQADPKTEKVEVIPNPIAVTQKVNEIVSKVVKQVVQKVTPNTTPTKSVVVNNEKIVKKDRGNEINYQVKPFEQTDTEIVQDIRSILQIGDTVFPKGSSGVYEYNGTSLILLRGNGANTITDLSTLTKGLEIYKTAFNSKTAQEQKSVVDVAPSLVNRSKKQQNKKC